MVEADLHVHTRNSDGTLTLTAVPEAAQRANVDVVAITDHDRPHPGLDDPLTVRDGVTIIHGIELRVDAGHQRVDLLGYGLDPTAELEDLVERVQQDRKARGRAIIECVEAETGVTLDIEPRAGLGRPHIARAIADSSADYDYGEAFANLIGDDCPCYVPRDIPSFSVGRAALADACAVVGLAHPLRYDDPSAALTLATDLDAVERYYPYDRDVDDTPVERTFAETDLLATGGSDAHDEQLGRAGIDGEEFHRFRAALDW